MIESCPDGIRMVETATTPTDKLALFARVRSNGGEGIALKDIRASYEPGRPNTGGPALKYKFWATASVLVLSQNADRRSVNMGTFGNPRPLGSVSIPVNKEVPAVGAIIEVRYLYAHRGGSLSQPVYLRVRTDIGQESCTKDQLKYKGEAHTDR